MEAEHPSEWGGGGRLLMKSPMLRRAVEFGLIGFSLLVIVADDLPVGVSASMTLVLFAGALAPAWMVSYLLSGGDKDVGFAAGACFSLAVTFSPWVVDAIAPSSLDGAADMAALFDRIIDDNNPTGASSDVAWLSRSLIALQHSREWEHHGAWTLLHPSAMLFSWGVYFLVFGLPWLSQRGRYPEVHDSK